jgi:hypothetical protein
MAGMMEMMMIVDIITAMEMTIAMRNSTSRVCVLRAARSK